MRRYYIASSLDNIEDVKLLHDLLQNTFGWTCTYDWTMHGSAPDKVEEVAIKEREGVESADFLIVLLPGGKGTHWEMGRADRKQAVYLISDTPEVTFRKVKGTCAFYWLPEVYHIDLRAMSYWLHEMFHYCKSNSQLPEARKRYYYDTLRFPLYMGKRSVKEQIDEVVRMNAW